MPAHLRTLDTCRTCNRPATKELRNGRNAVIGRYCDRHATKALTDFVDANPEEHPTR
jgi:biotin synthase-related radical SAM superfamily protein